LISTALVIPINHSYLRFSYVAVISLWTLFLVTKNLKFPRYITIFIIFFSLLSLTQALYRNFPLQNVFVSSIGLLLYSSCIFSLFKLHKNKLILLLDLYLKIAFYASIFAIFQEISHLIHLGFDFKWLFYGYQNYTYSGPFLKVPSVFTEPGYFAPFLIPAVYISIKKIIKENNELTNFSATSIIIALILTFSTIGYAGFLICLLFIFRSKILVGIIIGSITIALSLIYVPSINTRIKTLLNFSTSDSPEENNTSALIVLLNLNITSISFNSNPLLGTGIDSYESISEPIVKNKIDHPLLLYIIKIIPSENLNLKDGSNLFFRYIVEFGLIGYILIIIFVVKFLLPSGEQRNLQLMCLAFIFCYSLRTGQYLRFELWFFIIFYQSLNTEYNQIKNKILINK
jgi:hypothetical protein